MEIVLNRNYFPEGTNGSLLQGNMLICSCIELPWRENRQQVSCIPEGKYVLEKRYNTHFQWHLALYNVPGREGILIHPANNALLELKGCIAPVTEIIGEGRGIDSKRAFEKLKSIIFPLIDSKENVFLTIKNEAHESYAKGIIAHSEFL